MTSLLRMTAGDGGLPREYQRRDSGVQVSLGALNADPRHRLPLRAPRSQRARAPLFEQESSPHCCNDVYRSLSVHFEYDGRTPEEQQLANCSTRSTFATRSRADRWG